MHQLAHPAPTLQSGARSVAGWVSRVTARAWPGAWKLAVLLLAFLSIRIPEYFSPLRFVKPVVTGGLIGAYLIYTKVPKSELRRVFREPAMRWLLWYAGFAALAVPFAYADGTSFKLVANTFPFMILLTAAMLLVEPTAKRLDQVTTGVVAAVTLAGVMCLLQGAGQADRLGSGNSYDPNDLASMVALSIPLCLGVIAHAKRWAYKLLGAVGTLVCLAVFAQTGSRGGIVGLGVGMTVYLLAQRPSRFFIMLIVAAAMAGGLWQFGPEVFRTRARSMLSLEQDYNTNDEQNGRIAIWKRGIHMATQNPVLGVGPGNFAAADGMAGVDAGIARGWYTAHNTYVQAAAELGFPGLLLLLGLLVRTGREAWLMYRKKSRIRSPLIGPRPEFFACFMAFVSAGIFLSHAFHPLLFGVTSLCAFAGHVARDSGKADVARSRAAAGAAAFAAPAVGPAQMAAPRWGGRRMRGGLA